MVYYTIVDTFTGIIRLDVSGFHLINNGPRRMSLSPKYLLTIPIPERRVLLLWWDLWLLLTFWNTDTIIGDLPYEIYPLNIELFFCDYLKQAISFSLFFKWNNSLKYV